MRKFSHEEVLARQEALKHLPRIPLVAVLDNVRSLHNVGAMFRAADGAGIEKMFLCGITGYPPQGGIAKTALGAEDVVPWEHCQDVVEVVHRLKADGYTIVALEQAEGAVSHAMYKPCGKTVLIVGNEVEGISEALMALVDTAIEIPMRGDKNSLNASVAFGIAVFALRDRLIDEVV